MAKIWLGGGTSSGGRRCSTPIWISANHAGLPDINCKAYISSGFSDSTNRTMHTHSFRPWERLECIPAYFSVFRYELVLIIATGKENCHWNPGKWNWFVPYHWVLWWVFWWPWAAMSHDLFFLNLYSFSPRMFYCSSHGEGGWPRISEKFQLTIELLLIKDHRNRRNIGNRQVTHERDSLKSKDLLLTDRFLHSSRIAEAGFITMLMLTFRVCVW